MDGRTKKIDVKGIEPLRNVNEMQLIERMMRRF